MTRTNVNATLSAEARAQGTIVVPSNKSWTRACVTVLDPNVSIAYGMACGDVGSAFDIGGIAPGGYRLCVAAEGSVGTCGSAGSGGAIAHGSTPINLATGANAIPLAFGGTIGVDISAGGTPPAAACAKLLVGTEVVTSSCAITDGRITLPVGFDISSGSATIRVYGVEGFIDHSVPAPDVDWGQAPTASVSLSPTRALTGVITRPAGFEGTHVCVLATDFDAVFEATCLDPGVSAYNLPLQPGTYLVQFFAQEPGLAFEWYNNSAKILDATPILIGEVTGATANATLAPGGRIAGTVHLANGAAATQGTVVAFDSDGFPEQADDLDATGAYALEGLPAGDYRVEFFDVPGHAVRWYDRASSFEDATVLHVAVGETTLANQSLALATGFEGSVTFDGANATGGCVEVVSLSGEQVAEGCVDEDGTYIIDDVPAGKYKVLFTGFDGAADEWSGGSATFAHAATISIATGQMHVLDATLERGGTISGTSTSYDGFADHLYSISLYTLDGSLVATTAPIYVYGTDDFEYTFEHVPAGKYELAVTRDGSSYQKFYRPSGSLTPGVVTLPNGASWAVTNINVRTFGNPTDQQGGIVGYLNVPSTWHSATVCAVAVDTSGAAVGADCGPSGGMFEIAELRPGYPYRIVFTNGEVRTKAQYSAFAGGKRYFGNTTTFASAPRYAVTNDETQYLPVWFYADVTYQTTNFEAIQWLGDFNIYRPSANTFRPDSTMTRRDFAVYLYKAAGSPAVVLPSKSPFTDVKTTDSAYKALLWLRSTKAWTSTTFKPSASLDKKTEALILYRAAGSPAVTLPSTNPYKDIKSSDYAYKAVTWANKYKIVSKTSASTFGVTSTVKRKYVAASLYEWWWRYA